MLLRLGGIIFPAVNCYDGVAYEIYISGCNKRCKNCHNPEMQDFNYGNPLDTENLLKDIKNNSSWIDIISFLGGDPLDQKDNEFMRLIVAIKAKFPKKKLWLFTGNTEVPLWVKEMFDVIKVGQYVEELRQDGFPSSSNQKILRKGVDY